MTDAMVGDFRTTSHRGRIAFIFSPYTSAIGARYAQPTRHQSASRIFNPEITMAMTNRIVREGLVVGLIGFAAVALFYAAFDFLAARGFLFTVNLLGQAVFYGLRDPSVLATPFPIDLTAVVLYTVLHLLVASAIGLVVAWLVAHLEGPPAQVRLAVLVIIAGFFVTIFGIGMVSSPIKDLLPWWSVVLANVLAVAVAGAYLLGRHPGLARRLILAER
jgi:hypothetical protein